MAHAKTKRIPTALTIAGSDSGGGAGIQADLKTFSSFDVHGTTAITCLTAQNPRGVLGITVCKPEFVRLQVEAVFAELKPQAVKTGMLYSAGIIEAVVEILSTCRDVPLVVDPVMIATSGAQLLRPNAVRSLKRLLLPMSTLLTPNLDEAAFLLNRKLETVEDCRAAARQLHDSYGCAVLIKGGHLKGFKEAVDIYRDSKQELLLSAPFIKGVSTHGTGCTYSAAIAASLAWGKPLASAVQIAKQFITTAIATSITAGNHSILNNFRQTG